MEDAKYSKLYEPFAYNLYRLGFPMTHEGLDTSKVPIEDLIVRILTELPNPRFILGIPVIMHKNKIDTNKLYNLAIEYDAVNPIGWILEESYLTYDRCAGVKRKDIEELIHHLEPLKKEKDRIITTEKNKSFVPYARKRQTPTGKKWHILSGFREESFDDEFKRRCLKCLQTVLQELTAKN